MIVFSRVYRQINTSANMINGGVMIMMLEHGFRFVDRDPAKARAFLEG